MKAVGLITEYNPFHNGHLYHLREAVKMTQADVCIAVMSGNFVQRGEPAMIHKYARCRAAVDCGVNLVVELPSFYALSSAEFLQTAQFRSVMPLLFRHWYLAVNVVNLHLCRQLLIFLYVNRTITDRL